MRKLGTLGITLFGLWALILAVGNLFSSINMVLELSGETVSPWALLVSVSPGVAYLIAGTVLLALRHRLAQSLFQDEPLDVTVDPVPALRIGLILSGIWMLTDAATDIVFSISYPLARAINNRMVFGSQQDYEPLYPLIAQAIPQIVLLVVAVLLIRLSDSVANRVWNGRQGSVSRGVRAEEHMPRCCEGCGEPYDPDDYEPGADARCIGCGRPLYIAGA